ncbi:DgyrCDS11734 [Dimorphilus gyrociliatus]|uniref:DgyrCDS11734 n=1 Tax=Dimorphilus gyrociliatus TaxID=2664684 RepID=A0A7I8W894_9ANNE|nr:DgyrCDS11734 [Dimorphilus gyrociliatus]
MNKSVWKAEEWSHLGYNLTATWLFSCFILGTTLNIICLVILFKIKSISTNMNPFFISLSGADLAVSVLATPFSFISTVSREWLFGESGCTWYGFISYFAGLTQITTIAGISFERYLTVVKPFNIATSNSRRTGVIIGFCWLYSLIMSLLPVLGWNRYVPEATKTWCSIDFLTNNKTAKSYIIFMFTSTLILPFTIIIFSYFCLLRRVRKQARQTSATLGKGTTAVLEKRLILMISTMVICFVAAWTPYAVVVLMGTFKYRHLIEGNITAQTLPSLFAKLSNCYNPLIYLGLNKQFQEALINLFRIPETSSFLSRLGTPSRREQGKSSRAGDESMELRSKRDDPSTSHHLQPSK